MRNNFDDLVRERCKELLLAGHLARVIAAQQFMGHTDQQFGEFLAPLIQKETITEEPQEVTSENTQQETSVPNIRTGTVHLKPGYYAVCDDTGAEIFTGNIGEYRALDLHHGQLVEFRNDSHEIINQNLGDDPTAPLLHYIKHGIVELEPDSQELYIAKDINGQTIKELGCAFDIFYLRQMADRFNIHAGDTVDLYLKEDGYPYINWVYRGYDSETPVQNTSTVRKRTKTERESRSSIDYDLTGKKVAIYGIPPRMIQEIENTLIKEKGADSVEVQQLGTYSAGYKVGKAKMLDNTDLVIIAKTGISHSMSYDIVNVCKENNIPFAYANQPSLKRIEMAIYRALNGYPSDEISAGDLQYPELEKK